MSKKQDNEIEVKTQRHDLENRIKLAEEQIDILLKSCENTIVGTSNSTELIKILTKALELAKSINDIEKISYITFKIAKIYEETDKINNAINCYNEIIKSDSIEYQTLVMSYISCAFLETRKSNYDTALKMYRTVLKITQSKKDDYYSAQIYSNIGSLYAERGDYTASDKQYQKAYELYKLINNQKLMKITNSNIATNYYYRGNFQKALELKLAGIPYFQKENYLLHLSKDLNTIAVIYNKLGNLEKAIEYSLKSLKIKEKLNDNYGVSITLMNLGVFYHELGNTEKALDYYHKSLEIKESLGDRQGIAAILNNFGNISLEKHEFTKALEYFQKSLSIRLKLSNKAALITTYENLGITYSNGFNEFDKALNYSLKALNLAKEIGNVYSQITIQLQMVEILIKKEDLTEAEKYLNKCKKYINNQNNNNLKMKYYFLNSKLNKARNSFEKALKYHIKYSEVKDKVFNEDSSQKIAELQTKFETEQKEKEAEIFRLKNIELEKKNKKIKKQKEQLEKTIENLNKSEIKYKIIAEELNKNIGLELIGDSESIKKITELIAIVAVSGTTNILIVGESGTGKEIVARNIHLLSVRNKNSFYGINSSAIPDSLFESQFFGHEKNAFTGADKTHIGWFEIADNGTLFLDEIGTMSLDQQVKLLRVLEERKIVRLGSHREIPVDVRIISATNTDLFDLVKNNKFREDLYHRLATFVIQIPPLRERKEDISLLLEHFVRFFSILLQKKIKKIEKTIEVSLMKYNFPGNVRELKNIIERAMIITDSSTLKLSHFSIPETTSDTENEIISFIEMEEQLLLKALKATNYNQSKAAEMLKVERRVIMRKMKKFGITGK